MKKQKAVIRFALCIRNDGCDDLELRKVYQVVPDLDAAKEGYIRIIDESREIIFTRSITLYRSSCRRMRPRP